MGCPQACGVAVSCNACGLLMNSLYYIYGLFVDHFFSYKLLISNIVDALRLAQRWYHNLYHSVQLGKNADMAHNKG
jgi:hypothetical protein